MHSIQRAAENRSFQASACKVLIALSLLLLGLPGATVVGQQGVPSKAVQIRRVDDVIENWKPDQHLFIKGNVGASTEQLDKLEVWLDENGPHWTVVLMHDAKDENYVAPDGEKFRRMDAVEYALAHRLANQTEFGNLVHERTGESSGAVFVLYLTEREFAYYSTDVYDRRGLGQSRWVGNLDREVIRAMRSGDRIIDAVKNTVKQIEGRLEKQIRLEELNEQRAKERVKRERTKYLADLKSLIDDTDTTMLPRIEESARQVRTKYPNAAESELAKPPIDQWRTKLASLRKDSENPIFQTTDLRKSTQFREAKTGVSSIRAEINRFLDSYAAHQAFEHMIFSVEARLDEIADHPSGAATKPSVEAYGLIDQARTGHARGELGFAGNIDQAKELIDQGEQAIATEQLQQQQEAARKQLVRRTLMIVAASLGFLLLVLLWILNIRRRPALRRAHSLFEKQNKAVEIELAKIDEVVAQSDAIIGTGAAFAEARYEGETLQLGQTTLQQIENLKQMSAEAQRAIGSCYELLHPSNPIAEAANMFTGARYEHCINDLNGKSLHVPGHLDEQGRTSERIWMSFEEIFSDLHQRKNRTANNLATFETSLAGVNSQIEKLQSRIKDATELEKKLSRAARLDRVFKIPALFEKLIPSSQRDCDRALALANSDPVRAISRIVPEGLRKIEDGLSVANSIHSARENSFSSMDECTAELKKLGFDSRWIGESVSALSDRAENIVAKAIDNRVTEEASQFHEDLVRIGLRARRSLELGNELGRIFEPKLSTLKLHIETSRKSIASKLRIDVLKALHEEQYDPDVEVEQAANQLQSARAALDYGGVESVMESLEVFDIEAEHAERLVELSLSCLQEFDGVFAQRNQSYDELMRKISVRLASVESIKTRYADSALTLRDAEFVAGAWDALEPDDDAPTVERVMEACHRLLDNCHNSLSQLNANQSQGKILQAANSLDLAETDLLSVSEMLDEVDEHCQRIDQLAAANVSSLSGCVNRLHGLVREVKDRRTQKPTVQQHSDLNDVLTNFQSLFANGVAERDPFGDAIAIADFDSRVEDLALALKADRYAFDEATRTIGGAESELATAKMLVARSLNDRIPDSRTIEGCQDEVANHEISLNGLKQRLEIAHDDWKTVGGLALQLNSKIGIINGRLRQELEIAQQAVQVLSQAANAVYEAANWRGSYSIVVIGRPGSDELEHARKMLVEGNYARAISSGKAATRMASDGIEKAKQQVTRHRQDLARKAAEARRRRNRTSSLSSFSSSSGGSSSFGGFSSRSSRSSSSGSRSSSSSSRSSSSSSSSSSRSSGFSRSKW